MLHCQQDFLERRLQTLVFKLGLAKSMHHARVLIRQRHIRCAALQLRPCRPTRIPKGRMWCTGSQCCKGQEALTTRTACPGFMVMVEKRNLKQLLCSQRSCADAERKCRLVSRGKEHPWVQA